MLYITQIYKFHNVIWKLVADHICIIIFNFLFFLIVMYTLVVRNYFTILNKKGCWALIAVGMSMGSTDSWAGWFWGLAMTTGRCYHARADPMEQDFLWWKSGAYCVCPLGVSFWGCLVVFWPSMKLATLYVGSGAPWNGLWCRPSLATACALHGVTWFELQSDLQVVSICAELGGVWERVNCEKGLASTSVKYTRHIEARCCLSGVCKPLRDFRKFHSIRIGRSFS